MESEEEDKEHYGLQVILQEDDGTKYYTKNELETPAERDYRYLFEFDSIYPRIKEIGL